jgi:hypothetical protein
MFFLLYGAMLLLFPGAAVWAWRRGSSRALWILTCGAASALVVLALIAASGRGGNQLSATQGYARTAVRMLQFAMLAGVIPLVAAAASVRAAAPRIRVEFVYPIAVATALVSAAAGIVAAVYTVM